MYFLLKLLNRNQRKGFPEMKEKDYSEKIANTINNFLTMDDWHFFFDEQRGIFKFGLYLKGKIKKINYIVDVKENEYIVYAFSPLGVDEDDKAMMASMAEFICRANYGLKNGNFELDMRDGEIRFKCFADCEGITPTREMVRNSIYCPAAMFQRYSAGIADIIYGNVAAKKAVERCEKSNEEELRSLLCELVDEDEGGELTSMIAGLAEMVGYSGAKNSETSIGAQEEPVQIKTNLFGTEGE